MSPSVLQLVRQLDAPPQVVDAAELRVRTFSGEDDIEPWLALRNRAFARQRVAVRSWDRGDFQREMLDQPWWAPERLWLAESAGLLSPATLVGAVTLAERRGSERTVPVVHWLVVAPDWRQRGVGRVLMSHLEAACWSAGWREVFLETHSAWQAAARFYDALGYKPVALK